MTITANGLKLTLFLKYRTLVVSRLYSKSVKSKNTIDYQDVDFFTKRHDLWWNTKGPTKLLHRMNPLRLKLIKNSLASTGFQESNNKNQPLEGLKILDVGCGGGILSEEIARLGAETTGLDASKELINVAIRHAKLDQRLTGKLFYVNTSIEEFALENVEKYDMVVASEIVEHVNNYELFLKNCLEVLKPNGSIVITTLNRTLYSWLLAIAMYEYVLRLIPIGTHQWNKFITPNEMKEFLSKSGCQTKFLCGMSYNPLTSSWSQVSSPSAFYALYAVKQK